MKKKFILETCAWFLFSVCLILLAHALNMEENIPPYKHSLLPLGFFGVAISLWLIYTKFWKHHPQGNKWTELPVFLVLVFWVTFAFYGKGLLFDIDGKRLAGTHWPLFLLLYSLCLVYTFFTLRVYRRCSEQLVGSLRKRRASKSLNFHTLVLFFLQFGVLGLYLTAYNPGSTGLDTYHQLAQQYHLIPYSNWHPLASTLLMKSLLSIWDHFLILTLFQILSFCAVSTAFYRSFLLRGAPLKLIYTMALVLCFLPTNGVMLTTIVKDTQFSIGLLWLTWCLYDVVDRHGEMLTRGHLLSYFGGLASVSLLRFNGIFSFAFVAALFPFYNKDRKVPRENRVQLAGAGAGVLVMVLVFNTFVPLYLQADSNPSGTKLRTIYNGYAAMYAADTQDRLPIQDRKLIEDVANAQDLQAYYNPYNADPYMRQVPDFISNLSQLRTGESIRIYVDALIAAPDVVLGDKFNLALLTWSVAPDRFSYNNAFTTNNAPPDPIKNHYDFSDHHIPRWNNPLTSFFNAILYPSINNSVMTASLFWRAGFPLSLLLVGLYDLWRKKSPRKWMYLPLLSNLLAVFLTMPAQEFRYIYGVILLYPFLILGSLLPPLGKNEGAFTDARESSYNK